MKRIMQLVLAATFMSCGALTFTSCSKDNFENEIQTIYDLDETLLAKEAVGTWTADIEASGTTGSGQAYTHMVQALTLNADGTGHGATFFFDDDELVGMFGGRNIAPFNYQVDKEGKFSLDFTVGFPPDVERYKAMNFIYDNGKVTVTDGGKTFTLRKVSPDQVYEYNRWDYQMNGGGDKEQKSIIENEGKLYTHNHGFNLCHFIDTAAGSSDEAWLNRDGSISLDLRIVPVYVQSSNEDKAGDYYFVKCSVTPHNNSLWNPYVKGWGATRLRVYGYWFKDLDLEVKLVNEDDSDVEGLQYFMRPLPENKNDSKTYSNGTSITVGASVNGGYAGKDKGGTLTGTVSFSKTWTSSTSYQLETINFNRDG